MLFADLKQSSTIAPQIAELVEANRQEGILFVPPREGNHRVEEPWPGFEFPTLRIRHSTDDDLPVLFLWVQPECPTLPRQVIEIAARTARLLVQLGGRPLPHRSVIFKTGHWILA